MPPNEPPSAPLKYRLSVGAALAAVTASIRPNSNKKLRLQIFFITFSSLVCFVNLILLTKFREPNRPVLVRSIASLCSELRAAFFAIATVFFLIHLHFHSFHLYRAVELA